MFTFRTDTHISGVEVDLELSLTIPADKSYCPTYRFDIVKSGTRHKAGYIDLRIGFDPEIFCNGNIGYYLDERQRGHGYAAKAARLLAPLARAHHMRTVTITCNPDNLASAKTAENLGAKYLELIKLPKTSGQYKRGDRFKRRYIWEI
jgi:tagatose 1,6-diphosphate aldolase